MRPLMTLIQLLLTWFSFTNWTPFSSRTLESLVLINCVVQTFRQSTISVFHTEVCCLPLISFHCLHMGAFECIFNVILTLSLCKCNPLMCLSSIPLICLSFTLRGFKLFLHKKFQRTNFLSPSRSKTSVFYAYTIFTVLQDQTQCHNHDIFLLFLHPMYHSKKKLPTRQAKNFSGSKQYTQL